MIEFKSAKRTLAVAAGLVFVLLAAGGANAGDDQADREQELRVLRADNNLPKSTVNARNKEIAALKAELAELKSEVTRLKTGTTKSQPVGAMSASAPAKITYRGKERSQAWMDISTMMNWIAQHIEAVIALVAVFVGPFVSIRIARRQIKASLVSANRQAWINELRSILSDCIGKISWLFHANPKSDAERQSYKSNLEDILRLFSQAEMHLNPNEPCQKELIKLINLMQAELIDPPPDTNSCNIPMLIQIRRQLIELSQRIFKQEWKKIKAGK